MSSIWLATTPQTHYPSLSPNIEVDVAVIGGGIAGLITAYQLKQQGKSVAVIEARRIITGTTGHTTAHISIAHEIIYKTLIQQHGQEAAALYADVNQTGINIIAEISEREKIDCDFQFTEEYIFAPTQNDISSLEQEYEATKKLKLDTSYLNKAPIRLETAGAIRYNHQARFHPRKFLLRLAEKIQGNGSYIFEETRAVDVYDGEPMEIETEKGKLHAKDVVITTLYPFLDRGLYFTRLDVYSSYVIAATVHSDFPDAMFDSTEQHSHYLRRQPFEDSFVVLIGGEGHKTGEAVNTKERYQKLEAFARQHLDIDSIKFAWSTHDTYPYDNVPFIGKFLPNSDHMYVATGFQGWGMAHGAAAGKLITDLITNHDNPWKDLYDPGRFKPTKNQLAQNLQVGKRFLQSKLSPKPQFNTDELKPGEWKLYESQGEKMAVYRNAAGKLYAVSAACRHMGCSVNFNSAEQTWDCPCHGSRYSLDGKVLYGPTVKGLPKIDLETKEKK